MPIQVSCSCGKVFRVKNDRAGQRGKCPECGQKVVVPFPVLDADEETRPVPWVTFSEEWAAEHPPAAESPRPLDIGIDLGPASSPPPAPRPPDHAPLWDRAHIPPAVEAPPPPIDKPAHPSPPVAPPVRPQPQRVILVGVKLSFEDLFDLLFKGTVAMLCVSLLIGIVLGIAGFVLWAMIASVQR
jgi:hypothetical protein